MVERRRSTGRPARTRRWPRLGPRRPELARPREPAARRRSGTAVTVGGCMAAVKLPAAARPGMGGTGSGKPRGGGGAAG